MSDTSDPGAITAIAVRADDVVAALEANQRGDDHQSVLRVTPPYSGRMRARLHREGAEGYEPGVDALHVSPEALVADPPSLPHPDQTEDVIRSDPELTYSRSVHRSYHEQQLEQWRETVTDRFVETIELDHADGDYTVEIIVIGDP